MSYCYWLNIAFIHLINENGDLSPQTSDQSDIVETFSVGFFKKIAIHILGEKKRQECMWTIKECFE